MNDTIELKPLLDTRINLTDAPDASWHDAEEVFAEIEASFGELQPAFIVHPFKKINKANA